MVEYLELDQVAPKQDSQGAMYFNPSGVERQDSAGVYNMPHSSDVYRRSGGAVNRDTGNGKKTESGPGWTKGQVALVSMISLIAIGAMGTAIFAALDGTF